MLKLDQMLKLGSALKLAFKDQSISKNMELYIFTKRIPVAPLHNFHILQANIEYRVD